MNVFIRSLIVACLVCFAGSAWGHGYGLAVNLDGGGHPVSLTPISGSKVLDLVSPSSSRTPGPANGFLDQFGVTTVTDGSGTYYNANGGGPQTSGTFPTYTSATYRILSPLYFSDGTGSAVLASSGTHITIVNQPAGDINYPGAQAGSVDLSGITSVQQGYGVSLLDTHETPKHLFLGVGSTQTFGEYGFSYDVTVNFTDGSVVTTGPLVVALALRDPSLPGGSFLTSSQAQQDAATQALYNAVVPEPATGVLLGFAAVWSVVALRRTKVSKREMR